MAGLSCYVPAMACSAGGAQPDPIKTTVGVGRSSGRGVRHPTLLHAPLGQALGATRYTSRALALTFSFNPRMTGPDSDYEAAWFQPPGEPVEVKINTGLIEKALQCITKEQLAHSVGGSIGLYLR